jgi:EpsD family peptidyl-prolyl cis-trans isomerase
MLRTIQNMRGRYLPMAALLAMGVLAGCGGDKTPSGQVVASVEGADVTRRDLIAELQASGAGGNVSPDMMKKLQPELAQQVVNRKLLVAQAKKEGIDKTPEYLAAVQRADEMLLAQQLIQRWGSKLDKPSDSDAHAFIAANPQMFGERKIFLVDQVRGSAAGVDAAALTPLKSNVAVAQLLRTKGHPVERGQAQIDSMALNKAQYDQLLRLPPGEPIVAMNNGVLMSNVIVEARNVPVPEDRQLVAAKEAMAQQGARTMVENQLRSLRQSAKIEYQPGFAPPAGAPGTAGATPAAAAAK